MTPSVRKLGLARAYRWAAAAGQRVRRWERRTRPVDPEFVGALKARWEGLPEPVRTRAQFVGRGITGCEGTHGVFPRCNLRCTPCYHSRDANQVRVDGAHTTAQVTAQMRLLRQRRGPYSHAQLIGGEVSLLPPDAHAEALGIMQAHGREPMSFTHGDFDYDYLRATAVDDQGRRRVRRLSFAVHFDMMMFGRRGIQRPPDERALNPYRARFAEMLRQLRREHGVEFYLAHNMTVTPANLDQIGDVIRDCHAMGYGMFSFQPAAFVGDERRWRESYQKLTGDAVWQRIEAGAGATLDYRVVQNGDPRCNRTAYGFYVGERWHPFLDGSDPRDLAIRDAYFRYLGPMPLGGVPPALLAIRLARRVLRHPQMIGVAAGWLVRAARRVGPAELLRHGMRPVTFVMHQFMDAADVAPAWELMQQGITSDDPCLRETQERLAACHYEMAHPEDGTLVPACVQHSVLDPAENVELRRLLPLTPVDR
ncbi:MAG TPA: hypothetical protein VGM60_20875 [Pseudonocardia sp.]|uniref:hypothetical protein n=1 Tax=Pseudonocardia sp. TaxID=60912 RepID=UPI002F417F9F